MRAMTGMSSPIKPFVTDNEFSSANDLNTFFTRFESLGNSKILSTIIPTASDKIVITVKDVRKTFQCKNAKKAAGTDECSVFLLQNFGTELAPVWQTIFQISMDTHTVPLSWKTLHIKSLPKT